MGDGVTKTFSVQVSVFARARRAEEKKTRRERLQPQHRVDFTRNQLLWGSATDHGHARNYYYLKQDLETLESDKLELELYITSTV